MASTKAHKLPPTHPGEALQDILNEAGLSARAVALALHVPANRLIAILKGERGITVGTALRLGRYFGTSAAMWMNLQVDYELQISEDYLRDRIDCEVLPRSAT